ncbi:rhodopsin, GQ-coupled-like [Actinia tenebrosa]|uniref:Rhodopsin, GQ-coupled-like n=1 Tax=Actinia tenebrosa TaxID=6105 RepID=A0A6P8HC72_ACTTE|nr:rhodopsin, GQ-coupled-like [Actinia tenebrosa]
MSQTTSTTPIIFHSAFIATTAFCFICTVVISVGNFVVLFSIYKDPVKNLRNPSSILFTNLVFSDFLTGSLLAPLFSLDSLMDVYGKDSVIIDAIMFILGSLLLFVSNLTITAVSFDRLIAVAKPLYYKSIVTTRKIKIVIALIWILSLFICLLPVFQVPRWLFLLIYSHSHVSVPLVSLTTVYVTIFRKLRKHRKLLQNNSNINDANKENKDNKMSRRMQRDQHLTITIVLVMIFFCTASLPFVVCVHLTTVIDNCPDCFSENTTRTITSVFYFSGRCIILNAALDPFLLILRMSKVRQAVVATFGVRRLVRPRSRITRVAPALSTIYEPDLQLTIH